MNYVSAVCPHCKKELQIPDDAESIVCMYCAQPIDVKELLYGKPETGGNYQRLMEEAESLLTDDIFICTDQFKNIRSSTYSTAFQKYDGMISPALKAYCMAATESDEAADYFAGILYDRFQKQIAAMGIKKESDARLFEYRYMIVAFTIPAIVARNTPQAEALADSFLKLWNSNYPKNPLGKSNYESISNGFRKKFCYITTAVCRSLQKDDDCYELNAFRRFRDGWYAKTPEGKSNISEYYLFAPMIVRAIDGTENKQDVYRDIWLRHLKPCLKELEDGHLQECAESYEAMVLDLEQKWLH